jgi:ADP-ribosylglycohydrolase
MSNLPSDYAERVYAGVLGKIIGVYLGSPFEGWTYERILRELGTVSYYVNERLNRPLIVPDDDIAGTLTFLRAMPDYGNDPDLTSAQIGQTWLNYLIENKTVLWWGGMGLSTEHTAYLRLKAGVPAPESGSIARNGTVVAEQIGAQIFIDGWAMIAPGDPARAAELARRAGRVSHDGEAVHAAQLLAAMESQAFVERDVDALLDEGLRHIPANCLIARLIADLRAWHVQYPAWQDAFAQIQARYGYDKYGGGCHVIPNHAIIILALLYGGHSTREALTIANTCGWDTDCNSGNVGCLMGIKEGLEGLQAEANYREPVADRLYLPTADAGHTVTDALSEALSIVNIGRVLAGQPALAPKGGVRYHWELPGSAQGWLVDASPDTCAASLENVAGHSAVGKRSLAIRYKPRGGDAATRRTRIRRETYPAYISKGSGYGMVACPQLYAGQTVTATLQADAANAGPVEARLYVVARSQAESPSLSYGPTTRLAPGARATLAWPVETDPGAIIAWVGLELDAKDDAAGSVYLDTVDWHGVPQAELVPANPIDTRWLEGWASALSAMAHEWGGHTMRLVQNEGAGMAIQGQREWGDYQVEARLAPHMARSFGLAARVQGLRRYYALRLAPGGHAQLVRELDGATVLATVPYSWELYRAYDLRLTVTGARIQAAIDGMPLFDVHDPGPLASGAVGLLVEEGRLGCDWLRIG